MSKYPNMLSTIQQALLQHNDFDLMPLLVPFESCRPMIELPGLDKIKSLDGLDLVLTKSIRCSLRHNEMYENIIYAKSVEQLDEYVRDKKLNRTNEKYYTMIQARLLDE